MSELEGLSLDNLDDLDALQLPEEEHRLCYTIRLAQDSPYFLMPASELYGMCVTVAVKDGLHTFQVVGLDDSFMQHEQIRKLIVAEIK